MKQYIIITVTVVAFFALFQANALRLAENKSELRVIPQHELTLHESGNGPLKSDSQQDKHPDNDNKNKKPAYFDKSSLGVYPQPLLFNHYNGKYSSLSGYSQPQVYDPYNGNYDSLSGYSQPLLYDPYNGKYTLLNDNTKHQLIENFDQTAPQEQPSSKVYNLNIIFA